MLCTCHRRHAPLPRATSRREGRHPSLSVRDWRCLGRRRWTRCLPCGSPAHALPAQKSTLVVGPSGRLCAKQFSVAVAPLVMLRRQAVALGAVEAVEAEVGLRAAFSFDCAAT